jgi:hypothetical protein
MNRIMRDTSLEAFGELLSDDALGDSHRRAYDLVESNPNCTVKELLDIGVNQGLYPYADRNFIAPRITEMVNNGIIIRPRKRVCNITGKSAFVNVLSPIEWRNKWNELRHGSGGKIVKNRLEIESKTTEGLVHTVIEYHDGTVFCSCNIMYHRSIRKICHHIEGMLLARDGSEVRV